MTLFLSFSPPCSHHLNDPCSSSNQTKLQIQNPRPNLSPTPVRHQSAMMVIPWSTSWKDSTLSKIRGSALDCSSRICPWSRCHDASRFLSFHKKNMGRDRIFKEIKGKKLVT